MRFDIQGRIRYNRVRNRNDYDQGANQMSERQETTGRVLARMDEVVYGYERVPVLDRVSVTLSEGEFVGVAGPNGSAKTTMLRLFLRLIQPWRGSVSWVRHNHRGEPISMAYVPQQMAAFNTGFPSTCMEFVRSGTYFRRSWLSRGSAVDKKRVERCLQQVGMWEERHQRIGDLSGGQKQRLCIARALVQRPDVLVLDEPTTGMDAQSRSGLFALLRHQVTVHRMAVLMVTHDVEDVRPYSDRWVQFLREDRAGWRCFTTVLCNAPLSPVHL